MPLKYTIKYKPAPAPMTEPVTKFGGQPVWIEEPQWPLSRLYGTPMQFICQIALTADLFGDIEPRMAYLFITDDAADGELFPDTWEPDGGENAVIVQPGGRYDGPTAPQREGPSLYKRTYRNGRRHDKPVEYEVKLRPGEDPDEGAWDDVDPDDEKQWNAYFAALTEDKIGGAPVPNTNSDVRPHPGSGTWRLLVQLNTRDEGDIFWLNFASDGVGWAFISEDGRIGKFMWSR